MITDQSIIDNICGGNEEGLDLLFTRYYKPLVLFSNAYLNDIHKSEDIVQEQFIKFWNHKLYKKVSSNSLSSYLFTLVKNASLNWIKKVDVLADAVEISFIDIAEEEASYITEAGMKKIIEAYNELPERTRLVVEYVMIRNMKYKEVAEELNVSVNTIKTLLKLGLSKLRKKLNSQNDFYFLLLFKLSPFK